MEFLLNFSLKFEVTFVLEKQIKLLIRIFNKNF